MVSMGWIEATIIIFDLNWARTSESDHWELIHVLTLFAYHFVIKGLHCNNRFSLLFPDDYHEFFGNQAPLRKGQRAQSGSPSPLLATLMNGVTDLFLENCLILDDHRSSSNEPRLQAFLVSLHSIALALHHFLMISRLHTCSCEAYRYATSI